MVKVVSIALILAGIALMVFGNNVMNSFSSDVSRMFTGAPTDRAIYMLVGGLVLLVIGVAGFVGLLSGKKS